MVLQVLPAKCNGCNHLQAPIRRVQPRRTAFRVRGLALSDLAFGQASPMPNLAHAGLRGAAQDCRLAPGSQQSQAEMLIPALAVLLSAGPALADFQMPLAIPNVAMDWATMAAEGAVGTAEEAVAKAADVAQAVNPAIDGSPAQDAGNAVVEAADQVGDRAREGFDASPAPALKDAVSSVREAVPGPRDAARQSSESASNTADQLQEAAQDAGQAVDSVTPDIRPDKQALIQKLERDVLPKIEGQIAELNKADEPTDTTRAIKDQLEGMKANITQLLTDVRGGNNVGIQQDATGLQNIFAALREAIPKLNGDSGSG